MDDILIYCKEMKMSLERSRTAWVLIGRHRPEKTDHMRFYNLAVFWQHASNLMVLGPSQPRYRVNNL